MVLFKHYIICDIGIMLKLLYYPLFVNMEAKNKSSGPEKTGCFSQYHAFLYKVFMCFRSTVVPGWTINLVWGHAFRISSKCIKTISTYHNVYSNYISIL